MANNLRKSLVIAKEDKKAAKAVAIKSIQESILLISGHSQEQRALHPLWEEGGYVVGVGKPGKEAKEGRALMNKNDMWPYIQKGKDFPVADASFKKIFFEFEHMSKRSKHALELLGSLLVRSAYMLDHTETPNGVRYTPPQDIVDEIAKEIPSMYGVPLAVFLQYIDTIALNEDVKYYTKGEDRGKPYGSGAGRENNLLTCARLIAVMLERESIVDFADGFSRNRGVSKIGFARAKELFPMLNEKTSEDV